WPSLVRMVIVLCWMVSSSTWYDFEDQPGMVGLS
ncbi:MAG: hypothetical protein ACI9NT_000860, partial [Bacteroidia bacterium]